MTVLYQSDYEAARNAFWTVLQANGVPQPLWPNYARLMAEELACEIADKVVSEAYQKAKEDDQTRSR